MAKARKYVEAQNLAKITKKPALCMAASSEPDHSDQIKPILDGLQQVLQTVLEGQNHQAESRNSKEKASNKNGSKRDKIIEQFHLPLVILLWLDKIPIEKFSFVTKLLDVVIIGHRMRDILIPLAMGIIGHEEEGITEGMMTSRVAVIVKIVLPDQGMVEVRILMATRTTIEIRDQVGIPHQLTAETNNLFRTKHPQV